MYQAIINIEDSVLGSMHQVTVDRKNTVRVDGTLLPKDDEFRSQIMAMLASWSDHFEGVTEKELVASVESI